MKYYVLAVLIGASGGLLLAWLAEIIESWIYYRE